MEPIARIRTDGSVALILGEIIVGVVVLFIGVFMLASVEPVFGDLKVCTLASDAGTPQLVLNGSISMSRNMSFTPTAVARGTCSISLVITNVSGTTGTYVEARDGGVPTTLLANITMPATNSATNITAISGATGVASVLNLTAYGGDNLTINSTSYIVCCDALVNRPGPAGQYFSQVASTAGICFTVFGLVLIVIGLATAIGSLKNMGM